MKYCPSCKIQKNYNEYYCNKARKDGIDVYCIVCKKEKQEYKQEQKKLCTILIKSKLNNFIKKQKN